MGDFLSVDHIERLNHLRVFCIFENADHAGGDVQPARLKYHRHHRQATVEIRLGVLSCAPHAGVCGHGAIKTVMGLQTIAHQIKMFTFLIRRLDPIIIKSQRHWNMRKPGDQIPMQIHGIQFNMGHRVQKRVAAFF